MNLPLFLVRFDKLAQVLRSPKLLAILLRYQVLAGAEHRHILKPYLKTVVDVGANRGQFCLAVRKWAPDAQVFAFEPLCEPTAIFRKIFHGDPKVTFHEAAIGPSMGEATIHVSAKDDSSSLLPISENQERFFPGTCEIRTETISVGRLINFLKPENVIAPAMLKIDVQGFELEVLRGCEDMLEYFEYVYAECSFVELYTGQALADEIIAWLHNHGFHLCGIYHIGYDHEGFAVQGDFLFEKNMLLE